VVFGGGDEIRESGVALGLKRLEALAVRLGQLAGTSSLVVRDVGVEAGDGDDDGLHETEDA
jgi:hypothetical protein